MKAASIIGVVGGCVCMLLGAMMEGTSPMAFFNVPAMVVVFGGTTMATMASVGVEGLKRIPVLYKAVASPTTPDLAALVQQLVALTERARREGLLSLEAELQNIEDPFMRKGLQLVVDGTDPELVREIMGMEIDAMSERHKFGAQVFNVAGGFGPTMGIIGTVMGLVHVLENLSAPATLGPAISAAFIATLMGVGSANLVYLPVSNRLKSLSSEEVHACYLTLDGLLAVQEGENPRIVAEKLWSLVPPAERVTEAAEKGPNLRLADEPAAAAA